MQSKSLRSWVQRQLLDVFNVLIEGAGQRLLISARSGEGEPLMKSPLSDVDLDDGSNESNIFVISHPATVVDLGT